MGPLKTYLPAMALAALISLGLALAPAAAAENDASGGDQPAEASQGEVAAEKAPPKAAPAEGEKEAVAPAEESPKSAGSTKPAAPEELIVITIDQLAKLLEQGKPPRIAVKTKFSTLRGVAVRIGKKKLYVDVSDEHVAVRGVMGTPLSAIKSIGVLKALSGDEREAIRKASAEYLVSMKRAAVKAAEKKTAEEPDAETDREREVDPDQAATEALEREMLLEKYPPEDGWGPEKVFDITRKRIVLGLQPFGKDKTFLEEYDAWVKAYNERRDKQLELKKAIQAEGKELPPEFELLGELGPVPTIEGEPWGEQK